MSCEKVSIWEKLDNKCSANSTIEEGTMNCCADHLTEFAVMDAPKDLKTGALLGYALSVCLGLWLFIF